MSESDTTPAYQKKLSTSTVMGVKGIASVKKLVPDGKTSVALWIGYGLARAIERGESAMGPYTALKGDFAATNLLTGEEFRAAKIFLPDVAHAPIEEQLLSTPDATVQFAYEIGMKIDATAPSGYLYTCRPMLKLKEGDPINDLRASIEAGRQPKQLDGKTKTK